MTYNKKTIIHDINMEININSNEPILQIKKYGKPEFNIDEIDENMFTPSNIKNWSKIVLDTCDILEGDDLAYENKIIIRGKDALFEYFEELCELGISNIQNHDYILQIPTILYEYKDIIDRLSGSSYDELFYHVQKDLYDKYIKYFKDLIKSNLPPPNFTEIAKLIDVCIKFSIDNHLFYDTFLRLCYGKWYLRIDEFEDLGIDEFEDLGIDEFEDFHGFEDSGRL
jgi:hypothetical protein